MACCGPGGGVASPGSGILVEHPPVHARVAQLDRPGGAPSLFEMMPLPEDLLELAAVTPHVSLVWPYQQLELVGQSQEARVQIARDPALAAFGDALGRLCGVVALVLAEQHHLGAVRAAAQRPRLLALRERAPEVASPVGPLLRLEAPTVHLGSRSKHTSAPRP